MNTLTINATKPLLAPRFAWKEYRMLRGLWLASAIIAVVIQMMFAWALTQYRQDLINSLFTVAWSAAALYAVGAAITMFAAETEEHTRDYLRLLPGDWRPIFATKVVIAFASAVLLGMSLTLTGAWLAGALPSQRDALYILGVAGVAMLEFLAWGLLFSLWWKHPLLAAVAAMAAASFGAQWAILSTTSENNSWTAEAYVAAVPARLAICLVVFAVDVWLGRRWLYPVPNAKPTSGRAKTASGAVAKAASGVERPRLKMFGRLLWQTWRESWKAILVALPLSIALVVVALIPAYVSNVHDFLRTLPFFALVSPALLGALAFRADQKRDHRLFLATHAAWPRYVWFARHVVWLGTVLLLGIVIYISGSWIMQSLFRGELQNYLDGHWHYHTHWLGREFSTEAPGWAQAWRFEYMQATYVRGVATAWLAFLAAYGIGQLCSMVFKQTVLAGFLAILLAVVLAAWSVLMYLWEMNPLWFVLPIGIGALLATWLLVPSWILQQNQLKLWLWPAAAIALPLIAVVTLLPATRMAQLNRLTRGLSQFDDPFVKLDAQRDESRNAASQTALEYERLGAQIDEKDELILKHFRADVSHEKLAELAEQLTELTKRPHCRIPSLHLLLGQPAGEYLKKLTVLLDREAMRLQSQGELDLAFERLIAELRFLGHKLQNQLSWQFDHILRLYTPGGNYKEFSGTDLFGTILDWAQAEGQTSERIKEAIIALDRAFTELPRPRDAIYADRERVRRIIREEEPPNSNFQLAAFFNRLPGEQARALRALDILTGQAWSYAATIEQLIHGTSQMEPYGAAKAGQLRNDLRATPWSNLYAISPQMFDRDRYGYRTANQIADACATSFLVANEFENSGNLRSMLIEWTDFIVQARALSVQLALIAYSIDHGAYPETLDALVPDYLPKMIHDPYSGEPFHYRSEGLNLPLASRSELASHPLPDITADTPLIWSVGLGNNVLKEFFEYDAEAEWENWGMGGEFGTEPASDVIEQQDNFGRQIMGFEPTEGYRGVSMRRYVFLLPKIQTNLAEVGDEAKP